MELGVKATETISLLWTGQVPHVSVGTWMSYIWLGTMATKRSTKRLPVVTKALHNQNAVWSKRVGGLTPGRPPPLNL